MKKKMIPVMRYDLRDTIGTSTIALTNYKNTNTKCSNTKK